MMKNHITFFLIFIATSLFAQNQQFSDNSFSSPKGMVLYNDGANDFLIVADSDNGRIVSLDLSGTPPNVAPVDIITTGLNRPFGLSLNGSILYILDAGNGTGNGVPGRILTYDLASGVSPTVIYTLPSDARSPRGILYDSNKLYFSDVGTNKIYVDDLLTATNFQEFSDLSVVGAGPVGMVIDGSTMFIAGRDSNIIHKVLNVNSFSGTPLVATNFINFSSILGQWEGPEFLYLDNSTLYISGRDANEIGSADISLPNPIPSLTNITSATTPGQVIPFNDGTNDYLYIAESSYISFFEFNVLSTQNLSEKKQFEIYPNPTKDDINISGFEGEKSFKIYNLLGRLVMNGVASKSKKINISSLDSGMYLLKFDTGNVLKIIKE
ncbi:T9SS type A sorting domain-containing protein [Flavobacteriaceae bacterium]|nr:T9SS type A sorting domain-containing protein [Flavobacteriaceae bacterium]